MVMIAKIIASGLGTGYLPIASGTLATLLATLIWFFVSRYTVYLKLIIWIITLILSLWAIPVVHRVGWKKDDRRIVIDEIIGYWLSVLFLPFTPGIVGTTIILFRVMDILKIPPPMKKLEFLPGKYGVLADDLYAGILTYLIILLGKLILKWTGL